jgi:hypothetical protein
MRLPALLLVATLASAGCRVARAGPPVPPAASAPQTIAEGVVQRYLTMPYGELNGLRLKDGRIVQFGPLMAPSVRDAAAAGDRIRIFGHAGADGTIHASTLLNLASGITAGDQPPNPHGPPAAPPDAMPGPALQRYEVAGIIDAVLRGPRGDANGVILADGGIVYFRPDLVRDPLAPGQPFAAVGIGSRGQQGLAMEAMATGADLASARQKAGAAAADAVPPPRPQNPNPHAN